MEEKDCAECGQENLADAQDCSSCRSQASVQAPPESQESAPDQPLLTEGYALQISVTRIIVLTIVTSGVYILFWLYRTWKQLQPETGDVHYPIWHAATLFVPLYGLFRLHRHLSVIQELAQKRELESLMPPGLGVTVMALYWLLALVSGNQQDPMAILLLSIIGLALVTTLMVRAQKTLNAYWTSLHGSRAVRVPLGVEEIRFLIIVLAAQFIILVFLGSPGGATT